MSFTNKLKEGWSATPPPAYPPKSKARYSSVWNRSKSQLKASSYVDILSDRQDWLDGYSQSDPNLNDKHSVQRKTKSLRDTGAKKEQKQTKKTPGSKRSASLGYYQKNESRSSNSLSDYQGYSRQSSVASSSGRSFTYSPPPPCISQSPSPSSIPPVPPMPKQLRVSSLSQIGSRSTSDYMASFSQDLAEIESDIRILEIQRERHSQFMAQQKEEIKRMQKEHEESLVQKESTKKSQGRRRGKTLPGSLATPPPQPSKLLPPMTLNPIEINIPTKPTLPANLKLRQSLSTDLLKSTRKESPPPPPTPRRSESSLPKDIAEGARYPKSVYTALKYYGKYLSEYEKKEIQDYPEVYFVGSQAKTKYRGRETDDERGNYRIIPQDHLAYRYEIIDSLGRGSFGQVVKCVDHKTGQRVAIKLIRNRKRFQAQALTELNILKKLVEWDTHDEYHTARMVDHFQFRGHLCIVFECLSMNLYELIKNNHFHGLSAGLIKRFTTQILHALNLLHDHKVIHCDLKPENIMLKHPAKTLIKVIDFGSSCFESQKVYTYIQSRFYRSPEVILGLSYHMAIDMWSLGCIIAELYTGAPLFPGENEQDQLACIMEIIGVPERHLIDRCTRRKLFFDSNGKPRIVSNSKGKKRYPNAKSLFQALKSRDVVFIDFIQKCLTWDPNHRMTSKEALEHEWICK